MRRLKVGGFLPGRPPVMEVERRSDGSVVLLLIEPGETPEMHRLSEAEWREIVALDGGVYERPRRLPPRSGPPPGTACHGAIAYFEAAEDGQVRSAGAMDCDRALSPFNDSRRAAVEVFTRLALATRSCGRRPNQDAGMALVACFAAR